MEFYLWVTWKKKFLKIVMKKFLCGNGKCMTYLCFGSMEKKSLKMFQNF